MTSPNPMALEAKALEAAARVRMTLDLSPHLNTRLEQLAAGRQTSKAQVIRFAIELLSAATQAKSDGMTVGGWTSDYSLNREFIGV